MQLFHLALADGLGHIASPGERACYAVDGLPLPRRDHRVVHTMLGCQLRQRQIAPDRFQRDLGLKFGAVTLRSAASIRSAI